VKQVRLLLSAEEVQVLRFVTVNLTKGLDVSKVTRHPLWAGIVTKVRDAEKELQDPKAEQHTAQEEDRHRLLGQGYTEREVDRILALTKRT
jgi:hypothetical protein